MVLDLPIRVDLRGRCLDCCFLDRRGQISDLITRPTGAAERMRALAAADTDDLERQEAEAREKGQEDGDEDEEEDEDDE